MSDDQCLSVQLGKTSYSPGDTLEGTAVVTFNESTDVKDIQVKLVGTSFTSIVKISKYIAEETHDLLFDAFTVFPPAELDGVLASTVYTVPKGTYEYPFSFKIPSNCLCTDEEAREDTNFFASEREKRFASHPPDYSAEAHIPPCPLPQTFTRQYSSPEIIEATVEYSIKVTVHRSSSFSLNTHKAFPFQLKSLSHPPLYQEKISQLQPQPQPQQHSLSDPITIKTKRHDEQNQGWLQSIARPSHRFPVTFRVVSLFPTQAKVSSKIKPLVFIVSHMAPSAFVDYKDYIDEKSEKAEKSAQMGNGMGMVFMRGYTLKIFGNTDVKASGRDMAGEDIGETSTFVKSEDLQTIDLVNLKPIEQFDCLSGEYLCDEEYAMDISERFSECVVPDLEQEFSICNITYSNKISLKIRFSPKADSYWPTEALCRCDLKIR